MDNQEMIWLTPGGGIEPGESDETALRRELWEEVGLEPPTIGPLVWTRQHVFEFRGKRYEADERYYFVPVANNELGPGEPEEYEKDAERVWFSADDLLTLSGNAAPSQLANLGRQLLTNGLPANPIATGS